MAGVRVGRLGRRARFALCTTVLSTWAALSARSASAATASTRAVSRGAATGPVDHKSTNILFEILVGFGILIAVGVIVFLLTRRRGNPGSGGGGGGGGGNGFHPPPDLPSGGRQLEHPSQDEERPPVLHGFPQE